MIAPPPDRREGEARPASVPAGLTAEAAAACERLVELISRDRTAPTSVTDPHRVRTVHVADSLAGLEFDQLVTAEAIADIGSGAGLPGLVIAASLPSARIELIESSSRKCAFAERAVTAMGLTNVRVICERAEEWARGEGAGRYQAVTARAVGRLATLAELASPLLSAGGCLLAWKGSRDPDEEAEADAAAARLAMEPVEVRKVRPYPASRDRHIHLLRKNGPTPEGLPRRAGMASKRPFGSE